MMSANRSDQNDLEVVADAAEHAIRAIPPLWPLASSVAVNPFLGQANENLAMVAARLARVAGASVTMSRRWYRERLDAGAMSDQDLLDALLSAPAASRPANVAALKSAIATDPPKPLAVSTVADLAADASGIDWPGLIAERIGAFAAGYFDEGQALWAAPRQKSAYDAWRSYAMHDLTPEIAGLGRFAVHVSETPETALAAIARVTGRLGVTADAMPTYLHQMLMTLGGWSQYARYRLWQAELSGGSDDTVLAFLAIRLIWEEALYIRYEPQIAARWSEAKSVHARPVEPTAEQYVDTILQEAAERATQRSLARTLTMPAITAGNARPRLQAAFCIDVRSEVFRRALEGVSPDIRTLGFAGFFGLPTSYRRFASDVDELRLPVLLRPALFSCSGGPETAAADQSTRVKARAKRAWGRFKLAAVSSFAFVEATGKGRARTAPRASTGSFTQDHDSRNDSESDVADERFCPAGAAGRPWCHSGQ
jgi:uncharacterized protein YbcC (UPF0753/DUF2309 family)